MKPKINTSKLWGVPIAEPKRYAHIPEIIRQNKCKVLMEIGVYKGIRAEKMILAALETPGNVSYYGFDLFEDYTDSVGEIETEKEAAPKPWPIRRVYDRIRGAGVNVLLFKGFSRDTLPTFAGMNIRPDFVYIDGGHSFETVENDWNWVKQITDGIVVFDDYLSAVEDVGWGCNRTVDAIDDEWHKELIEPPDKFMLKKVGSQERFYSKTWLAKVWKNTVKNA